MAVYGRTDSSRKNRTLAIFRMLALDILDSSRNNFWFKIRYFDPYFKVIV